MTNMQTVGSKFQLNWKISGEYLRQHDKYATGEFPTELESSAIVYIICFVGNHLLASCALVNIRLDAGC